MAEYLLIMKNTQPRISISHIPVHNFVHPQLLLLLELWTDVVRLFVLRFACTQSIWWLNQNIEWNGSNNDCLVRLFVISCFYCSLVLFSTETTFQQLNVWNWKPLLCVFHSTTSTTLAILIFHNWLFCCMAWWRVS